MTPRNTKSGASASVRRMPKKGLADGASSSVRAKTSRMPGAPSRAKPTKNIVRSDTRALRWWMLPLVIVAALGIFVASYYPVAKVQYRETRERGRLQAELEVVKARNARLSVAVNRLKTPAGVEDYARLQLGMVKRGEHVIVVTDGTEPTPSALGAAKPVIDSGEAVNPPAGPWTAFLDSFFGVK